MAPNTEYMFDNDNQNSMDKYAYPYFHESTPLLYHLIVTHFGNRSDPFLLNHYQSLITSTDADDADSGALSSQTSSQTSSPTIHSEKFISRRIKFIGRRILSRCKGRPQEAKWVDSCGENALFRFCQLVRFQKEMENDLDILQRIQEMDTSLTSSSSKRKLKLDSTAELTFFILNCLINVDKNALNTLNKWGETPLHQFVGHCSFDYHNAAEPTAAGTAAAKNNCATSNHGSIHHHHHHHQRQQNHGLSYHFLELMLKASPDTVYQTNFQRALPLHVACSLGQINTNQPFSALDSMVSIDKLLTSETINKNGGVVRSSCRSHQHYSHYAEGHLQIIRRLVEYYPKGVLAIDINGCTPLYRAVDSINCSAGVVAFLLHEMENSFVRTTNRAGGCGGGHKTLALGDGDNDCLTVKFLFYKAIMGLEVKNVPPSDENGNKNDWYRLHKDQNFTSKAKNEDNKKVLSPMEGLWKAVFVRRQVKHPIPYMKDGITCASIADVIDNAFDGSKDDSDDRMSISEKARNLASQFGHMWEKIILLICCAFHGSIKMQRKENLLAVHAGVYCATPSTILNLLLRLYPNDLLKCDEMGNTPLILSILSPSYKEQWGEKLDCSGGGGDNDSCDKYPRMKKILEAAPEAASVMDAKGRLPLHIAIDEHWDWDDGVKDIFLANPTASSINDPESHLLPFMLASRSDNYSCPIDSLTNAYTLLRADPSVLNMYAS